MGKLRIFALIGESFAEIRSKWRTLLRALLLPALAISTVETIQLYSPDGIMMRLLFWALSTPFYVLFAVVCHRTVILGPSSLPGLYGLFWSERETRFFGWTIALIVVGWALGLVIGILALVLPSQVFGTSLSWLPLAAIGVIAAYFSTRLSMVFPATAVDQGTSLEDAWYLSAGNGVRLLIAISVPVAVLTAMAISLSSLFTDADSMGFTVLIELIAYAALTISVCILSVAYKKLSDSSRSTVLSYDGGS